MCFSWRAMCALRESAISFRRRMSEIYEKPSRAHFQTTNSSEVQGVTSAIRYRISGIEDSPTSRINRISLRLNISPRILDINRPEKRISWLGLKNLQPNSNYSCLRRGGAMPHIRRRSRSSELQGF